MKESRKEYLKEYRKKNQRSKSMNLNLHNDEDIRIIEWLDSREEGISAYLKRLVQKDMKHQMRHRDNYPSNSKIDFSQKT